jgi:tetratricopeptide (TPR) repeat protein
LDNQTRQKLKNDKFVSATNTSIHWAEEHRSSVITAGVIALVAVVLAIISVAVYNHRSDQAANQFSAGMQVYSAPIATPGEPVAPGTQTFPTAVDRAKAANAIFAAAADKYSMTPAGRNARYFAAITAMEMGQTASAESSLNQLADGMDKDTASLAKEALATLYHQTGRDEQAINEYKQIIDKPTEVETAGRAQLQLGTLYESMNRPDDAKKIYAELKDKDPKGVAGEAAAQRLGGPQAQ